MSPAGVLFLPGNGHHPVRLEGVRRELASRPDAFALHELAYPRAATYDDFLDRLERECRRWCDAHPEGLVYATGIGGLVALSLRARGVLEDQRLVLQGAVLWGLEQRRFPRLMRLPGMPWLLTLAFRSDLLRARFKRRYFRSEPSPAWLARFFEGYADAAAFAAWFRWLTPALLRELERELPRRPRALENLELWWGDADAVVAVEELRVTERALGVRLPLRTFPDWGHYPMIDDPAAWVREVGDVLATADSLP